MRLTVETGPLAGTVVTLDREHPAVLGSGPDCTIRVQEAGVHPQQAVVKALRDQGFGIKALAPGLRLNGAAIEASPLRDGDVIELGTTRVAFGQLQQRGLPHIAGYRILEEVGRGGMGMVYRAEQVSLHREVALKVLNRDLTQDPAFVAKFVAEARSAAKLQHPNVVQVFQVEHDNDIYYYAMELMHEGSLEDWLKQHGVMPVDRALRVVADAASGLAYAESLHMVHRDIKPDNLMIDQHGAVKIADLGLAHSDPESDEKAIGTPHFMAPEQVLRKEIDHRTDLYALGCTFYRLVTGKTPFRGQSVKDILRAQVKDDAEPAHKVNPAVSAEVGAIIQKLMAKDPAARYQTANDLLEELGLLLRPPPKKGLWIGLAAVGALVAGGAIYWAVTRDPTIVEVEKRYDDPEKQQFADEIKRLKKDALQKDATIALQSARLSGLVDRELADAFDKIAAEHAGTVAADDARQRSQQLRKDLEERNRQHTLLRAKVADHLATLRQAVHGAQETHDYAGAMKKLAAPAPAEIQNEPDLAEGVAKLREQVLGKARERLATLRQATEAALTNKDEGALVTATAAYGTAVENAALWPAEMHADIESEKANVQAARTALADLSRARGESIWQQYRTLFTAPDGLSAQLDVFDLAAMARAASTFASGHAGTPAAERATGLAAAATHAQVFVEAMDRAMAAGQLQVSIGDGAAIQVARWDRVTRQLALVDPNKRGSKEQLQSTAGLPLEAWTALADQVGATPAGARECFLGFIALRSHGAQALSFLQRLRREDDASGTGAGAYPLGTGLFDQLLRRLPDQDTEPWAKAMRSELQAGQRLAAGLRALSEQRNLAAAGYIEKLLAEHPYSYLVAVLP